MILVVTLEIKEYINNMPRVKVTEYKGFLIIHGPLFKRIENIDGPYSFRTIKEAKKYIDENLLNNEKKEE